MVISLAAYNLGWSPVVSQAEKHSNINKKFGLDRVFLQRNYSWIGDFPKKCLKVFYCSPKHKELVINTTSLFMKSFYSLNPNFYDLLN